MKEYNNDLNMRDNEMESMRISFDEEVSKKEKEKQNLRHKLEDQNRYANLLENDLNELKNELRNREETFEIDQ